MKMKSLMHVANPYKKNQQGHSRMIFSSTPLCAAGFNSSGTCTTVHHRGSQDSRQEVLCTVCFVTFLPISDCQLHGC